MHATRLLSALLLISPAVAQPNANFELRLPDFNDQAFSDSHSVIDLPDKPINRLSILVIDSVRRNISASGIHVWINGRAASNILNSSGVERGLLLTMDPSTLNKRPDELFDTGENTIEILAKDKRDRSYYQSWILRSTGRVCSDCPAGFRNSFFTYSASASRSDPEGVPPEILIDQPGTPPVVEEGKPLPAVLVKGVCASAYSSTVVSVNGHEVASIARQSGTFFTSVSITPEMKEILVEAADQKGGRRTVVIPLAIKRKQRVRPRFQDRRYALVVGISDYGKFQDAPPALARARADAREVASGLETLAGFKNENIRLLIDDQASRAQIRTGFSDFAAQAGRDDLLVIYVAAHGLHDPTPGRGNQLFFAPYGTQLKQIDSTAISFEELEALLNRYARTNHTFLIFDVGHDAGPWKTAAPNVINNHLLNLFSEQEGRAVLVSGSAGEVAQERVGGSRDFNSWLTAGLGGEADLNQDGVVTADELFRYVSESVRQQTGGQQNPRYRLPARNAGFPFTDETSPVTRGVLATPPSPVAQRERRVALVIGNAEYAGPWKLKNPVHDAMDVKAALEKFGFQVTYQANGTLAAMNAAIDGFAAFLKPSDVALFFYAGHGMRINDTNLLVPIDYPPSTPEPRAMERSVNFDILQKKLEASDARLRVLIADACRNNPYQSKRSWGNGWSHLEAGLGTYLALSASPGQTASDNPAERNGLFTKFLLQQLKKPPPLSAIFRQVRNDVYSASKADQVPYLDDQVIGEFWFAQEQNSAPPATAARVRPADSGAVLLEDGLRLYREHKCAEAAEKFDLAVRVAPEDAFARNAAGMAYACQGQFPQAVLQFGKAILLQPTLAGAYYNRGNAYLVSARYSLAVDDFSWAIEEQPKNSEFYTRRGRAYFGLRQYTDALKDLNLAAELDPSNAKAFHIRGQIHVRLGDLTLAKADFQRALERQPTLAEAASDLAALEKRTRQPWRW